MCSLAVRRRSGATPFRIGRDGTREEVIEKYRRYMIKRLRVEAALRSELRALRGKRLGCYCAPLPCHGDVLVALLGEAAP